MITYYKGYKIILKEFGAEYRKPLPSGVLSICLYRRSEVGSVLAY